jgi:hypothetical protein
MFATRFERSLPLAGILFGILLAIALYATSGEPGEGASVGEVYAYWSDHGGGKMWLSIFGLELAALLLSFFGGAVYVAIRSAEAAPTVYAPLALGGAILAATGFAVTSLLPASLGRAAADKGDEPGIQTTVYALEQLRSWDWLLWTPGLTVMLVGAGLGGLRTCALPRWLSWAAIVLGIALFTPVGFFAFFALPLWMVAAGVILYRRQQGAVSRAGVVVAALTLLAIPVSTASAAGSGGSLVGTWARVTTCADAVKALGRPGLERYTLEAVAGNGFIPGVRTVEQLKDTAHPCRGAVPRKHSHFFTKDGRFGSLDWRGEEVDDGTYKVTGNRLVISKEFPSVTFIYRISNRTATLTPVIPMRCSTFRCAWAVQMAQPGKPWRREAA